MERRSFISGLAGIITANAAPAIIRNTGILMPIRAMIQASPTEIFYTPIWKTQDYEPVWGKLLWDDSRIVALDKGGNLIVSEDSGRLWHLSKA